MAELLPIWGSAVAFGGLLTAGTLLYWAARSRRDAQWERVGHRVGSIATQKDIFKGETASKNSVARFFDSRLAAAGIDEPGSRLAARMATLALLGVLACTLMFDGWRIAFGAVLGVLPLVQVQRKAEQRAAVLSDQLPEALDLITRTMRAGHAFSDAMRIAAYEMPAPMGDLLSQVSEETRLGKDLRSCLENMVRQSPKDFELRLFAAAVLLQRDTGGNLAEILDKLATTVRDRIVFRGKVRALTAEVRLSGNILTAMPALAAIALLALRPGYLGPLFTNALGQAMLGGAIVSVVFGLLIMRRLAQVES